MGATTFPVQAEPVPHRSPEPHVRVRYVVPAFEPPEDGVGVEDRVGVGDRVRVEDFERVEDYLCAYLDDQRFKSAYLAAYERWSDASAMLYRAGCKDNVLAAGQRARETIQAFARALGGSEERGAWDPRACGAPPDGLSAVIETYRPRVGDARCDFLQSLFDYWRVLNDVIERQQHGGQEVEEPLRWEDARRIVVLTALVMVEIDRSI